MVRSVSYFAALLLIWVNICSGWMQRQQLGRSAYQRHLGTSLGAKRQIKNRDDKLVSKGGFAKSNISADDDTLPIDADNIVDAIAKMNGNAGETDKQMEEGDEMVDLPYGGILDFTPGATLANPVDLNNPLLNPIMTTLDDLPGAEGSPERNEAIQKMINDRAEAVRQLMASRNYDSLVRPAEKVPTLFEQILRDFTFQSKGAPTFQEVFYDTTFSIAFLLAFATLIFVLNTGFTAAIQSYLDLDFIIPNF